MKNRVFSFLVSCLFALTCLTAFPDNFFEITVGAANVYDSGSTDLSKVQIAKTGNADELGLDVSSITYRYNESYNEIDVNIELSAQNHSSDHMVCGYVSGSNDNAVWDELSVSHSEIGTKNSKHYATVAYNFPLKRSSEYKYCCFDIGYGYALNGGGLSSAVADANYVSIMKLYISFSEMASHTTEVGFTGEATNNIGTRDVFCGDYLNIDFSSINSPLYPTAFDSYEVTSSDTNVAEIVNTYDYTNGTEPLRYVSSNICAKNEGTANIICKFRNAIVGNNNLKEYSLVYTVSVKKSKIVEVPYTAYNGETRLYNYNFSYDFFASGSTTYNHDLATFSLLTAMSAFTAGNSESSYTKNMVADTNGYTERAENIASLYSQLEFDNIQYYNYDTALSNSDDKVAFSLGRKEISKNGSTNTLISVIIRGGDYGAEWASNFRIGDGVYATGFGSAAQKVHDQVMSYIEKLSRNNLITGKLNIWITGYSRGAAVANITAAMIDADAFNAKNYLNEYSKHLNKNRIYVYTFATPMGTVEEGKNTATYNNIFNIVNPVDMVPRVALTEWGFGRYGKTKYLPAISNQEMSYLYPDFRDNYFKLADSYYDIDYYSRLQWNNTLFKVLNYVASSREDYNENLQNNIVKALESLYKHKDTKIGLYANLISQIVEESIERKLFNSDYDAEIIEGIINGEIALYEHEDVLSDIGYLIVKLGEENNNLAYTLATVHYPELYLSWMLSIDTSALKNNFSYNVVKAHCPVDIYVYNESGDSVCIIKNEKILKNQIAVDIYDGNKILYLDSNQNYKIVISGYDEGPMDYSIELCDITDLSTSDLRSVEDIEITPNTVVTTTTDLSGDIKVIAETSDGDKTKIVEYTVDKDNEVTIDYLTNETDTDRVAAAKEAVQKSLEAMTVSNSTAQADVKAVVNAELTKLGTEVTAVVTVTVTEATKEADGTVDISVVLSKGEATDTVAITRNIAKLSDTVTYTKVEAKEATCIEDGYNAHWKGSDGNYYTGAESKNVTTFEALTVKATGHKFADGKCTVCGADDPDHIADTDEKALETAVSYVSGMTWDEDYTRENIKINKLDESADTVRSFFTALFDGIEATKGVSVTDVRYEITDETAGKVKYTLTLKCGNKTAEASTMLIAGAEEEPAPVVTYYTVTFTGEYQGSGVTVTGDRTAGATMILRVPVGYTATVISGGDRLASVTDGTGTFTMPANNVTVRVESYIGILGAGYKNAYIFSYDRNMKHIKTSSVRGGMRAAEGEITVKLGTEYAGKRVTLYSGRKNTKTKLDEAELNSKGEATFAVRSGKNYTLIVE